VGTGIPFLSGGDSPQQDSFIRKIVHFTKRENAGIFSLENILMKAPKNPKLLFKGICFQGLIPLFMGTIRALASAHSAQTKNPTYINN